MALRYQRDGVEGVFRSEETSAERERLGIRCDCSRNQAKIRLMFRVSQAQLRCHPIRLRGAAVAGTLWIGSASCPTRQWNCLT